MSLRILPSDGDANIPDNTEYSLNQGFNDEQYYGFRRSLRIVKEAIPIERYAGEITRLEQKGQHLVGRCPLHQEKTPSFKIRPEKQTWHCFGACGEGGDLLDLFMRVEGYRDDEKMAGMVALAMRYDVELGAPESWYARQRRQQPIRDLIDREKIEHIRLLVFRLIWMPWLRRLPDWTRAEATESAWQMSRSIALMVYERRSEK